MTTNLATILATKIRTALDDNRVGDAEDLAHLAVQVHSAGLSLIVLPEQEQPRVSAEAQRHPSGVEVTQTRWVVNVDGHFAGIVSTDTLAVSPRYDAYYETTSSTHGSLDAAVAHLVAQQRTPSPERSIDPGRDDAEEDSRREAEAVQS